MSQTHDTELRQLDLRIRAITFIYHKLAPQAAPPPRIRKRDALLVSANNIAVILTRWADAKGPVAVTARITSTALDIFACEEDYSTARNIVNDDEPQPLSITELEPSPGTVSDIISREPHAPPRPIDLKQHASDIVGIFNSFAQTPFNLRPKTSFEIHTFITRRCARIIYYRLTCDRFIFGETMPFLDIIKDWRPKEYDTLVLMNGVAGSSAQFKVAPSLAFRAKQQGIACEVRGGSYFCEATLATAPLWIQLLHDVLSKAKQTLVESLTRTDILPSDEVFEKATYHLLQLRNLLAISGFRNLFEIPSLSAELATAIMFRSNKTSARPQHDSSSTEISDYEHDAAELNAEEGERPASLALRYLKNIVAWVNATESLLGSKASRENTVPLRLCLMNSPIPGPDKMDDVWKVFRNAAANIERPPRDETTFQQWLDFWRPQLTVPVSPSTATSDPTPSLELSPANPKFSGTIHCEAALMGAIVGGKLEGFTAAPGRHFAIGAARKCCWCCAELARLLGEKTGQKFLVPNPRGQVFDWALPEGIPVEVARALVESLDAMLVKAAKRDFASRKQDLERQTSSVAVAEVSLGGVADAYILEHYLHVLRTGRS